MTNHSSGFTEPIYGKQLEEFFIRQFRHACLPSHDFEHHQRVWHNAKSIAGELTKTGYSFTAEFMLQLHVACMTHDIGMSVNIGENHGRESSKLCKQFMTLAEVPLHLQEDILFAVENHDRKEYSQEYPVNSLFTILSVADDTDAFGYTGLYRYIEIYSARGVPFPEMGRAIISNAKGRYSHMVKMFGFLHGFITLTSERFSILTEALQPGGVCHGNSLEEISLIIRKNTCKPGTTIAGIAGSGIRDGKTATTPFFHALLNELSHRNMF